MKNSKICLISSSGGHYEQLKMLAPLTTKYDVFWVTEKTDYVSNADYYLKQTDMKDKWLLIKMSINFFKTINILVKERPDVIISTGTMVALPMLLLAKLIGKKTIYIETFSRIYNGTRSGRIAYKLADLFIIQWETLKEVYPKAVYGGSIY